MAQLHLLFNTVWDNAIDLVRSPSTENNVLTLTGGPRHLYFKDGTDSPMEFSYVNGGSNLTADFFVMSRADLYTGHEIELHYYDTYTSSKTAIYDVGDFAETLYGPNQQDWVYKFSSKLENKQGFSFTIKDGGGGSHPGKIYQTYFCESIPIDYISEGLNIRQEWSEGVINRQLWKFDERIEFDAIMLSADAVSALENIDYYGKPFFLYDESGVHLPDRLWHVIALNTPQIRSFESESVVRFELYKLRSY